MLNDDIVVDTNIFMHAANPDSGRQAESIAFLAVLKQMHTMLCVDEGFDLTEAQNRSQIGMEYLKHLKPGSYGHMLVAQLARTKRLKQISRRVPAQISSKINQKIFSSDDRVFARVAFNSIDKLLVSHDFTDIPQHARDALSKSVGLIIVSAAET